MQPRRRNQARSRGEGGTTLRYRDASGKGSEQIASFGSVAGDSAFLLLPSPSLDNVAYRLSITPLRFLTTRELTVAAEHSCHTTWRTIPVYACIIRPQPTVCLFPALFCRRLPLLAATPRLLVAAKAGLRASLTSPAFFSYGRSSRDVYLAKLWICAGA